MGSDSKKISPGWAWATLREIGDIVRGVTYSKNEASPLPKRDSLPILRANNINGELNFDNLLFVPASRVNGFQLLQTGDVIIAMSSGSKDLVGKAAILTKHFEGSFGSFCAIFRPIGELDRNFMGFFFQSHEYRRWISSVSSGVNINNLRREHLESISIPLPPLPEQHRIVAKIEELFSKLDAGIETLKKVKVEVKRYRQAVLRDAFSGKLTAEWRARRLRIAEGGLRNVSGMGERKAADVVLTYQASPRIKELRTAIETRIRHSDVTSSPHEVLKNFMLEMVLDGVDLTNANLIDGVISAFMLAVSEKIHFNDQLRNYLKWARDSVDALKSEGLESRVLQGQLDAWVRHSDEGLKPGQRTITMPFGSANSMISAVDNSIEIQQLEKEGIRWFRERVLGAEAAPEPSMREDASAAALLQRIREERKKLLGNKYKEPEAIDTSGLPELPEGWVWAYLGELGKLSRGHSKHRPRDASFLYGGKYPFVQTGDIRRSNGVISLSEQTYSERGLAQSKLWPVDTLCITIAANIGETAILRIKACFPDSVVGLICDSRIAKTWFVQYYFKTIKQRLESLAPATAQRNINVAVLNRIAFPVPSLKEQEEIISEIDRRFSVADQIEKTVDRSLKEAERLRQSILKRAFEGKLVPQDPNDPPASELLEQIRRERAMRELEKTKKEKVKIKKAVRGKALRRS